MPGKIIIDTDPGKDDAIALLLALASPEELEVVGVTVVAGNVALDLTARNARILCEMAGRPDIAVHAGCDTPLARHLVGAEHLHGASGLDGIALRPPRTALAPGHAVDFIIETLRAEPEGTVSLVAIGPLTNIATAIDHAPDIIRRVREIVVMGGVSRGDGNVTPMAEFNIHADPEAAQIVFSYGARLTVVPLDCTRQAVAGREWIDGIEALGTRVGAAVASWLKPRDDGSAGSKAGGMVLHDPCAIAWLIRPDLFLGSDVNAVIETKGEFTAGMTVIDWRKTTGRAPNCHFLHGLDRDGLLALLAERLARLGHQGTAG